MEGWGFSHLKADSRGLPRVREFGGTPGTLARSQREKLMLDSRGLIVAERPSPAHRGQEALGQLPA